MQLARPRVILGQFPESGFISNPGHIYGPTSEIKITIMNTSKRDLKMALGGFGVLYITTVEHSRYVCK